MNARYWPWRDENRFGASFTVGDFDADGLDDLVVGGPREDRGDDEDFGLGIVVYGHPATVLIHLGAQFLPLGNWIGVPDLRFGSALAAGRFSGHHGTDLAIAAPQMDLPFSFAPLAGAGPLEDAGAVLVYPSIVLFRDGFGTGNTSRWSETVP